MNVLFTYLTYLLDRRFVVRKTNEFVFKIRHSISNTKTSLPFEIKLNHFRDKAKASQKKLSIKDFGAGSKKMGNVRKIQSIYKNSVSTKKWQRIIYNLVREAQAKNILEMGTSLGFSTVYLAQGTQGKVTTIEACPETHAESSILFEKMGINNIHAICATFDDFFAQSCSDKFDFVFIDGHHDGNALVSYVDKLKPYLLPNALVLVDDIRWSSDMNKAWGQLKKDAAFTAHVDCFRMGILNYKSDN